MLALARLNRDGETRGALGVRRRSGAFARARARPHSVIALALAWFSLLLNPDASARIDAIKRKAQQEMQLGALEPGKFMSPDNGATVIYPRAVVDNEARDVFMFVAGSKATAS